MSKKQSPLDIMNMMGKAAQAKSQAPHQEPDEDDAPAPKGAKAADSKKKAAVAMATKKKGSAPKAY